MHAVHASAYMRRPCSLHRLTLTTLNLSFFLHLNTSTAVCWLIFCFNWIQGLYTIAYEGMESVHLNILDSFLFFWKYRIQVCTCYCVCVARGWAVMACVFAGYTYKGSLLCLTCNVLYLSVGMATERVATTHKTITINIYRHRRSLFLFSFFLFLFSYSFRCTQCRSCPP